MSAIVHFRSAFLGCPTVRSPFSFCLGSEVRAEVTCKVCLQRLAKNDRLKAEAAARKLARENL